MPDKIIAYHGTNRIFLNHDLDRARTELNDRFQGDWICYTQDMEVAEKYAHAGRNKNFDKDLFFEDLKDFLNDENEMSSYIYEFFNSGVELGHDKAMNNVSKKYYSDNEIDAKDEFLFYRKMIDYFKNRNIDVDDFFDLLEYVEDSNFYERDQENDIQDIMDILNSVVSPISDELLSFHKNLGFKRSEIVPQVYTAEITANNILRTDCREQARNARENGYDLVIYNGMDCVENEPEILVSDAGQVKLKSKKIIKTVKEQLSKFEYIERKIVTEVDLNEDSLNKKKIKRNKKRTP